VLAVGSSMISGVAVCAGCRQQHVVAALMSQPGFHLSCVDYLLGHDTPAIAAAAASSNHDNDSFSFVACMLTLLCCSCW